MFCGPKLPQGHTQLKLLIKSINLDKKVERSTQDIAIVRLPRTTRILLGFDRIKGRCRSSNEKMAGPESASLRIGLLDDVDYDTPSKGSGVRGDERSVVA
jgi:hypothetical protein